MTYTDLKVYKSDKVLQTLRKEIEQLYAYIKKRCSCGRETGIQGPIGDLLLKYSDKNDSFGLRAIDSYCTWENVHGLYQLSYYSYSDNKKDSTPNPLTAFMIRDAVLDFNPTLPVHPMIYANSNISHNDRIDFIIWPDREKITDIHFWSRGEDMTKLLNGLDNI